MAARLCGSAGKPLLKRLPPTKGKGEGLSANIGSSNILLPSMCSRTVEWPNQVIFSSCRFARKAMSIGITGSALSGFVVELPLSKSLIMVYIDLILLCSIITGFTWLLTFATLFQLPVFAIMTTETRSCLKASGLANGTKSAVSGWSDSF